MPGIPQSMGLQRVRHDLATEQCVFSWHLWPHFERHWYNPVWSCKQPWITKGGTQFKRDRKANMCFMLSEGGDNDVKYCYRLKACVLSKLVCWTLALSVTPFGCGGLWEVTGLWESESQALKIGISAPVKETPESSLTLSAAWGRNKKTTFYKLEAAPHQTANLLAPQSCTS